MANNNVASQRAIPTPKSPISDYNGLVQAVQLWCDRDDDEFCNQIPNFIDFAQHEIFRGERLTFMEKEAYLQVDNGQAYIPSDWMESKYLMFSNGWKKPRETSLDEVLSRKQLKQTLANADEVVFCRTSTRFLFTPSFDATLPADDGSLDGSQLIICYYGDPNRLSENSMDAAQYLLTVAPDLLLYTTCKHASYFLNDDDSVKRYSQLEQSAMSQFKVQKNQQDYSASSLVIPYAVYPVGVRGV